MIQVLVVHDTQMTGDAITPVLRDKPGLKVIGSVMAIGPALAYLAQQPCDILVASSKLPNQTAFYLAHFVYRQAYPTKVLVTDMPHAQGVILQYLEAGIQGYVHENESGENLLETIYALYQGNFAIHPSIAACLMLRIGELKRVARAKSATGGSGKSRLKLALTEREHEVFQLLALGCTNQEIASTLVIQVGTVKCHVHHILRKLHIHKRKDVLPLASHFSIQPKHLLR